MGKIVLGAFLAALAMFIWGAVFWMTPFWSGAYMVPTNEVEARAAVGEYFTEPGVYSIPSMNMEQEEWEQMHREGPVAVVAVRTGSEPMDGGTMISGFIQMFLLTFVTALFLGWAAPVLHTYGQRVGFAVALGGFAAIFGPVGDVIWWMGSWSVALVEMLYFITAMLVAGFVLAKFVAPRQVS